MPISVLIADDHRLVREGLSAFLDREGFNVSGEASNGREAVAYSLELRPNVAILDIAMPILNGLEAAREIRRLCPRTQTVLLSMHADSQYILEGLRAGAKGIILKTHAAEELVRAVRRAALVKTYISPEITDAVLHAYQRTEEFPEDRLSSRERQVLQLVAEGKSTKEAANGMEISVKTAETYRSRMMEKLDIHSIAGLVRYAVRNGIVQP